jgi:nicotinamidase-related amidase
MASDEDKRSARLARVVEPATTAVVTMELQRGIVGDGALLPALADACAEAGTVDAAARVCAAARSAGSRVVHCTAEHRTDGAGFVENCSIFALGGKLRREKGIVPTAIGSEGARLMPQLGEDPRDITIPRLHGMSPFTSTSLDQVLRNLGTTTVVAVGVSVNLGIFGLCMSAVDLGYQVVVVRDAVAGVPADYADRVIDGSLSLLATLTTADELCALWATR